MTTDDKQRARRPARRGERNREKTADFAARRHRARMLALQVLYEIDLTDHNTEEVMGRAFAVLEAELEAELQEKREAVAPAKLDAALGAELEPGQAAKLEAELAPELATVLAAEIEHVYDDSVAQISSLVEGVLTYRDELDQVIEAAAPARLLTDQAAIERNVLRLAVYELLHRPELRPAVPINEAVELAKGFGGENSGRFINGVLRTVLERHPRAVVEPAATNNG